MFQLGLRSGVVCCAASTKARAKAVALLSYLCPTTITIHSDAGRSASNPFDFDFLVVVVVVVVVVTAGAGSMIGICTGVLPPPVLLASSKDCLPRVRPLLG